MYLVLYDTVLTVCRITCISYSEKVNSYREMVINSTSKGGSCRMKTCLNWIRNRDIFQPLYNVAILPSHCQPGKCVTVREKDEEASINKCTWSRVLDGVQF